MKHKVQKVVPKEDVHNAVENVATTWALKKSQPVVRVGG